MRNSYKPIAILLTFLLSMNHLVLAYCQCSLSVSFASDSCCSHEEIIQQDTCCEVEDASDCNECAITLEYDLEDFDLSKKVFLTALASEQILNEFDPHFGRELKFNSIDYGTPFRPPPDRVKLCIFRI